MPVEGARLYAQQYVALMKKNFLLKQRRWASSCFEVLLPMLVMLAMVGIRNAITVENKPAQHYDNQRAVYNITDNALKFAAYIRFINYKIAFSPSTAPQIQQMAAQLPSVLPFTHDDILLFPSGGDVEDYVTSKQYTKDTNHPGLIAAIIFSQVGTDTPGSRSWSYTIRMNATANPGDDPPPSVPNTFQKGTTDDLQLGYDAEEWQKYFNYGFLLLQIYTDSFIANYTTGRTPQINFAIQPFPTEAHIEDSFATLISSFLGLMFTLVFLWPVTRIVKLLVEEKESRIKEAMKMMGLHDSILFASWFSTYVIIFALIAALITAVTSNSVYKYSDKGLIFIYFFLFGVSVFCFCYLLSVFFTRARIASTISAIVFLGAFFPYYAVFNQSTSLGTKTIACLSTPICFSLGASAMAELESAQQGVTNESAGTLVKNFSFSAAIGMFIFDIFFYIILAVYLERVLPSTYGIRLPWNFCCRPSYWRGESQLSEEEKKALEMEAIQNNPNFEPPSEELSRNVGIKIRKLRKEFPGEGLPTVAVNDISLDIYQSQIFALLGHNGAGKTTTISMLSGMFPPTAGDSFIYGKSIRSNMPAIRRSLGVCPQHNILFDDLTVSEHLELFAMLKGLEPSKIPAAINEMINQVGMVEKTNSKSAVLSGGQKRKLSVGIALIADSKIIFLDEPTSGMDPYSRRSTWDLLRKAKEGRVIILTTHFMDEADQLGDRIAIMAKGEVKCNGSSLFLKSRYGVGYTMTLTKDPQLHADSGEVVQLVKKYVPEAEKLSDAAGEVSFRLPFECSKQYPALFADLDQNMKNYGVVSYSISVTTLEEVFLRVGENTELTAHEKVEMKHEVESFRKKSQVNEESKGGRQESRLGEALSAPYEKDVSFVRHVKALLVKRWHNAKRDKKVWTWQILYPFLIILVGVGLVKLGNSFTFPKIELTTCGYNSPNRVPYSSQFDPIKQSQILTQNISSTTGCGNSIPVAVSNINTTHQMSEYLLSTYHTYKESRYGAYFYEFDASGNMTTMTIFINTTAAHAVPVFWSLHANLFLQSLRPGDPSVRISADVDPFPVTADQLTLNNSLTAVLISIGFAFIPASFAAWVVKERETKAKHQQIISGVQIVAYWVSMYIWDVINFLIPGLLAIIVLAIYNISELLGEAFGATVLAIILYGTSITSLTYLLSFLFTNHATSQNVMLIFYIFTGAILLVVSVVLSIIESTRATNNVLIFIYRLLPNFCFGDVLASVIVRTAAVAFGGVKGVWEMKISGYSLLYMAVESVVYFLMVLLVEFILSTPDLLQRCTPVPNVVEKPFEEDPDVIAEKERVQRGDAKDEIIRIEGLKKVYSGRLGAPPKSAVKGLWLGIPKGECFGYLGINGAGKTTTLQMLTGDSIPTAGTAWLGGKNILNQQREIRNLIGYCPQFDALIETMTAREHLWMYARIKGVPEAKIGGFANNLIEQLGLKEYADRPCGGYSGGNKRKLSVGISLIGNPSIVFLDEPSTGMDPKSRRFMWDLISSTMSGRSVILTTHSMEECEALCSRIGIMVSGRLRCLGSASHLKSRYGMGYQFDANTGKNSSEPLSQFVKSRFPKGEIIEKHEQNVKYRIPRDQHTLGELFEIVEQHRQELGITEYSISETTLEQIFISFARQQDEETGEVAGLFRGDASEHEEAKKPNEQRVEVEGTGRMLKVAQNTANKIHEEHDVPTS